MYLSKVLHRTLAVSALLVVAAAAPVVAAFHVYPDPQEEPLPLGPGAESALQPIEELVASDTMYIRLAMLGTACTASGVAPPTVFLEADGGEEVEITLNNVMVLIFDSGANYVGYATMYTTSYEEYIIENDVFLVKIFYNAAVVDPINWQIKIRNNDGANGHGFTWVVADNEPETKQSWIDVSSTTSPAGEMDYDDLVGDKILVGQSENQTLQVANMGTGPLTIEDTTGTIGASDFEIISVPAPAIDPNDCGDVVIAYNAPATPGESTTDYLVDSDDALALADPTTTHNRQVTLSATRGRLEVMLLLDTSGSMPYLPAANGPEPENIPANPNESRWGRLKVAADQFLTLLATFGAGVGRFGVSMFPDITQPEYPPSPAVSAADFHAPTNIESAEITAAQGSLDDHTPSPGGGATSMGQGIAYVIGSTTLGNFENTSEAIEYNRRWMVLMSDGAHNSGPPDPPEFYRTAEGGVSCPDPGTATAGQSFMDKEIGVITVAYGDETGTPFEVDHDLLETLACKSGGIALNAGINDVDDVDDLAKAFREAVTEGLNLEIPADPGGLLRAAASEVRPQVVITPYDTKAAFVVDWDTFDEERVRVQLLTPTCELITPETAQTDPNVTYHSHPRYKIYAIDHDYLRNAHDAQNPRYGTWTLIISGIGLDGGESEPYEYQVITRSRLKLGLDFDRSGYFAGDPIELAASLTLDGKPIPNAAVHLELTAPGRSAHNWLAHTRVTEEEYASAAERLHGEDVTAIGIKSHAVHRKGLRFADFKIPTTIPMVDAENPGTYTATISNTSVPGHYDFYVTAIGQTEEGVTFRRERRVPVRVGVRPEPKYTLVDVQYRRIAGEEPSVFTADVRVWPRDRFGNVVLVDPATNPSIGLTAEGGELIGALSGNLVDGSYSRSLRYSPDSSPVIGLRIAGEELIARRELPAVTRLHYADRVLAFTLGHEAEEGANRHRDPQQALGELTAKQPEEFVSLGAAGSLIVGVHKRVVVAQGDDDVTVFVRGDDDLRSYVVEAWTGCKKAQWVELGRSPGVTQSFSLGRAGLEFAPAIRIRDVSGRTRDVELKATATPGVSIRGVAFKETRKKCLLERWIRCLLEEKQRHLGGR